MLDQSEDPVEAPFAAAEFQRGARNQPETTEPRDECKVNPLVPGVVGQFRKAC